MMKNALWVDPADQSLWFYYQFLLATIISPGAYKIVVPNLSQADRIEYVNGQLLFLTDLLDGAEDSKWIYNALIDCTTALWQIKELPAPHKEKQNLRMWLDELRKLDPLRRGRWEEMWKRLGLGE